MTERKPPGVGFETWVERQIREATARGEFDNLPGAGKPIADLDEPHDEQWWIKQKLRREQLSYLPPTIALRREAEEAHLAASRAGSEAEVRRIVADINARIVEGNRKAASGPPLNLAPFDVDHVVRSWRGRQAAVGCPGCGLHLPPSGLPPDPRRHASPECWQLYGEVQGFALSHLELVRDLQQLTVDAYAAQHAPRDGAGDLPPISVAYALVGLHLAVDRGLAGSEVRAAHQRMGRPDRSWPRLPAPEHTGAMTVFDVAAAGVMVDSPAGHAAAVRAWAAAVWQAWASHYAVVAALADRLLR